MRLPSWIGKRLFPTPTDYIEAQKKVHPVRDHPDRADGLYYELIRRLPSEVQDLFNYGHAAKGELEIPYPDAYVVHLSHSEHAIIIQSGLYDFFHQVSRALFTQSNIWRSSTELLAGSTVTFHETVDYVGRIFHELMEAFRTCSPVNYSLAQSQSDLADTIAGHAEIFILAHEIGHILIANSASGVKPKGKSDEFEADRIALEFVLGYRCQDYLVPNARMVYAGAVFSVRVYAALERLGYTFQGTHPPAAKRLNSLREHAVRLKGGKANYLRLSTTAFTMDRVLEAVERNLAGFDLSERREQILANLMAIVIECAAGHLDENKAAAILSDELVEAMGDARREVAQEAGNLFCPATRVQDSSLTSNAEREAEAYSRIISKLSLPERELFLEAWSKACPSARSSARATSPPATRTTSD